MMTLSGIFTDRSGGVPSLGDIATGLSRMPRFGGQTLRSWNVAQHSMVVADLMKADGESERTQLYGLAHDFHEMFTGDIVTDFKTTDMKRLQHHLDERIWTLLGLKKPSGSMRKKIKKYDRRALLAEAATVTPFETYSRICQECSSEARHEDLLVVDKVLHDPAEAQDGLLLYVQDLLGNYGVGDVRLG